MPVTGYCYCRRPTRLAIRDQGIGLDYTVKNEIVAVFIPIAYRPHTVHTGTGHTQYTVHTAHRRRRVNYNPSILASYLLSLYFC